MIRLNRNYVVAKTKEGPSLVSNITPAFQRKQTIAANVRQYKAEAWDQTQSGGRTTIGQTQTSSNVARATLENIFVEDPRIKRKIYRDMYYHDPVCGGAVDVYSNLPFSEFHLTGIKDREKLEKFHQSLESLHLRGLLPGISTDHLVLGTFIGNAIFDPDEKIFSCIMPQNLDNCSIVNIPLYGVDPIIDLIMPKDLSKVMQSQDPRVAQVLSHIPEAFIERIKAGRIPLDPASTIYIPRRTMTSEPYGVSFFERVLPVHLIEKALMRGTIDVANRRQRSLLHVMVGGDDEWIPTQSDLEAFRDLFLQGDMDPTGAIIVTRTGVNTNEIRAATEFWNVDSTFEYSCLAGDTLIPTTKGLIRIDEMGDRLISKKSNVNYQVLGDKGLVKVDKWLYRGKKKLLKITLKDGTVLKATKDHRIKVFDLDTGEMIWKEAGDITATDHICINYKKTVRKSKLPLNLPNMDRNTCAKNVKKPEYMTPDLAFIMAMLVSEGHYHQNSFIMCNTDFALVDRYIQAVKNVFGVDCSIRFTPERPATKGKIDKNGKEVFYSVTGKYKPIKTVSVHSRIICHWLACLGLTNDTKYNKRPAHWKVVPWSILQADEQSQLAYLASYIEGDGFINFQIGIGTVSKKNSQQLHTLLFALGIPNKVGKRGRGVIMNGKESHDLYERIKPYLVTKKIITEGPPAPRHHAVPNLIGHLLNQRRISYHVVKKGLKRGESISYNVYKTDSGKEITLDHPDLHNYRNYKTLIVESYNNGAYYTPLQVLKKISPIAVKNLKIAMESGYRFEQVKSIRNMPGLHHTYDLSINKAHNPAFVANGIVVHNCAMKYRAFGLSEGILTGEVSLSTLDASLSVMLDNIRNFRSKITTGLFYEKLFPAISAANDFQEERRFAVTGQDKEGTTNFSHLYRTHNSESSFGRSNRSLGGENINTRDLLIPKIVYHKHLSPEGDQAYLTMLNDMTSMGVPVPISMLAAAGSLDINSIIGNFEEDLKMRAKIAKYNEALQDITQQSLGAEQGQDFVGSALKGMQSFGVNRGPGLFNRDYDPSMDVGSLDEYGKRRNMTVKGRNVLKEKVLKTVAETLAERNRREVAFRKANKKLKTLVEMRSK